MNSKSPIFRGVLENAGLGEVSFYLKKVKKYLEYVTFSLDNTNFDEVSRKSKKIAKRIEALKGSILELDVEIENLGMELVNELEKNEESEGE
jgi:hypothetical protein